MLEAVRGAPADLRTVIARGADAYLRSILDIRALVPSLAAARNRFPEIQALRDEEVKVFADAKTTISMA